MRTTTMKGHTIGGSLANDSITSMRLLLNCTTNARKARRPAPMASLDLSMVVHRDVIRVRAVLNSENRDFGVRADPLRSFGGILIPDMAEVRASSR